MRDYKHEDRCVEAPPEFPISNLQFIRMELVCLSIISSTRLWWARAAQG
jgi:hypothetical protein